MILYHNQRCAGFTLIETIIVVTLSSIMMLTLSLLIYTFNKTSTYHQTAAQSSDSASTILREAESLISPASAVLQSHPFASATYTSTPTSLVLEIPSIDSSGIVIAGVYDYAAFYVVETNAYRLLEANAASKRVSGTKQLSSTIQALTFTYSDADFTNVSTTTVDVQTRVYVQQDSASSRQREQIRLRNH